MKCLVAVRDIVYYRITVGQSDTYIDGKIENFFEVINELEIDNFKGLFVEPAVMSPSQV